MAAMQFPIVLEPDDSAVTSAYVVGLPVYAQGATPAQAERAVLRTLTAYLAAHPDATSSVAVKVATIQVRVSAPPQVAIVSVAALVGSRTSHRKAAASRTNGRLGGRPRGRRS